MPNAAFGGGLTETAISGPAAVLLAIATVLILCLSRRKVVVVALLALFLIPAGNVLVIAGVHLMPVRVISLFGCVRLVMLKVLSPKELRAVQWNWCDNLVVCWAVWRGLAVVLDWLTWPATILEVGHVWSAVGMYLVLRYFIQDRQDILAVLKIFAFIAAIQSIGMVIEQVKSQNPFGIYLGGGWTIPNIRNGRIRSQGTFSHSILAGAFGATLIPLLILLWRETRSKLVPLMGIVAALVMVATSASSTPIGVVATLPVAFALWPMRNNMRVLRWSILLALFFLNMIMNAPVWFLIARVQFVEGSTAFFRAQLIDGFFHHFWDWWLVGVKSTFDWGESMWDLSNQFVAEGETAGLLGIVLFVWIIKTCYSRIGTARKAVAGNRKAEWTFWLLGCAFFGHLNAYFGCSYYDNTQYAWFSLIVITLVLTGDPRRSTGVHSTESVRIPAVAHRAAFA